MKRNSQKESSEVQSYAESTFAHSGDEKGFRTNALHWCCGDATDGLLILNKVKLIYYLLFLLLALGSPREEQTDLLMNRSKSNPQHMVLCPFRQNKSLPVHMNMHRCKMKWLQMIYPSLPECEFFSTDKKLETTRALLNYLRDLDLRGRVSEWCGFLDELKARQWVNLIRKVGENLPILKNF